MIIGRNGEQGLPITDKTVSKQHCEITPSNKSSEGKQLYLLKDLGSTQGTFVDGKRILQTTVTEDTTVRLGSKCSFTVKQLLAKPAPKPAPGNKVPEEDISNLRLVYKSFTHANIEMQKSAALKNFYRSLPPVLLSVLFALTLVFGDNETIRSLRPFMGVLTIAAIGGTTFMVWRGQKQMPERRTRIDDRFKIDYLCPHCHNFLGYIPYEGLLKKGECSYCHCKWVEKKSQTSDDDAHPNV